jgi:hypothetical protein
VRTLLVAVVLPNQERERIREAARREAPERFAEWHSYRSRWRASRVARRAPAHALLSQDERGAEAGGELFW